MGELRGCLAWASTLLLAGTCPWFTAVADAGARSRDFIDGVEAGVARGRPGRQTPLSIPVRVQAALEAG